MTVKVKSDIPTALTLRLPAAHSRQWFRWWEAALPAYMREWQKSW